MSIAQPVAPLVVAHPSSHIHRVVVVVAVAVVVVTAVDSRVDGGTVVVVVVDQAWEPFLFCLGSRGQT